MAASEILQRLKNGDYVYTLSDIQDYLVVPQSCPDTLDAASLRQYADYASKFLHIFVYKLEELPELERSLEVLKECYSVHRLAARASNPAAASKDSAVTTTTAKNGKNAVYAENLLYHLITKLLKKKHLSWVLVFSECLYGGLQELVTIKDVAPAACNLAVSAYVALWNSVISSDKDTSSVDPTLTAQCRAVALKLLGISNKDAALLAERLGQIFSKIRGIKNELKFDGVLVEMVHHAFGCLVDRYRAGTDSFAYVNEQDAVKSICQILYHHVRFCVQKESFAQGLSMCQYFVEVLAKKWNNTILENTCQSIGLLYSIAIYANKIRGHLPSDSVSKPKSNAAENSSTDLANALKKCIHCLSNQKPSQHAEQIIQGATFALEHLHPIAQYASHQKLPKLVPFADVLQLCQSCVQCVTSTGRASSELSQALVGLYVLELKISYNWLYLSKAAPINQSSVDTMEAAKSSLQYLNPTVKSVSEMYVTLAEAVIKLGRQHYYNRQFSTAIPFLETTCQLMASVDHGTACTVPSVLQSGRHFAFLTDSYRHECRPLDAVKSIVHGVHSNGRNHGDADANNVTELVECWVKVKGDLMKVNRDNPLIARSLLSVCQDPSFCSDRLQSPGGSTKHSPGGSRELPDPQALLEAELWALKSYWTPLHECRLQILSELSALSQSTAERAHLSVERVQILWMTRAEPASSLQQTCEDAIQVLTSAVHTTPGRPRTLTSDAPYLYDHLAQAHLWAYIVRDVDPTDILKNLQQEKDHKLGSRDAKTSSTTSLGLPSDLSGDPTVTSDPLTPADAFSTTVTVAMETESLATVTKAVDLWERMAGDPDTVQSVRRAVEGCMVAAGINKLAKRHLSQHRALTTAISLAGDHPNCQPLCLHARAQLLQLMATDLRQPQYGSLVIADTERWLAECGSATEKLKQGVYYTYYLLAKANTLLLLGKAEEGATLIQQAMALKTKHFKPRTKETMLTEACLQEITARYSHALGPQAGGDGPGQWDTRLEQLHQATRLVGKVVCCLMGNWIVNTATAASNDVEKAPDNLLDKWDLLDRLLSTLYDAGLYAIDLGEAREATCLLSVGLRLAKAFSVPRRLAEFHLAMASLDTHAGKVSDCRSHLHVVSHILEGTSLGTSASETSASETDSRKQAAQSDEDDDDFKIQTKPMAQDDAGPEQDLEQSDGEGLDRSGCASPQTKQKRMVSPKHWTHEPACFCDSCQDLSLHQLTIWRFSIEALMNINENDYQSANGCLRVPVDKFGYLTSKAKKMLERHALELVKWNSESTGKKKKVKDVPPAHLSVYQELIVDVCLQICTVAVGMDNIAMFEKWKTKCEELCDVKKYPWMFSKATISAELQYLKVGMSLDFSATQESKAEEALDDLCRLMNKVDITEKGVILENFQTPKPTSARSRLSKPRKPSTVLPNLDESSEIQSPDAPTSTPAILPPAAPVKARAVRAPNAVQLKPAASKKSRSAVPHSGIPFLNSPSVMSDSVGLKTPKAGVKFAPCESASSTSLMTPKKSSNLSSLLKTPASVCGSRRAVLDMLINSESDEEVDLPKKGRGRGTRKNSEATKTIPKIKATKKTPAVSLKSGKKVKAEEEKKSDDSKNATKKPEEDKTKKGIFSRKSKSAKVTLMDHNHESEEIKPMAAPVQSLFSRNTKGNKEAPQTNSDVYDFEIDENDENKPKGKSKKAKSVTQKKAPKSRSSKAKTTDMEVRRSADTDVIPDILDIECNIEPVQKKKDSARTRLTRAKTKHTEEQRTGRQTDDEDIFQFDMDDLEDLDGPNSPGNTDCVLEEMNISLDNKTTLLCHTSPMNTDFAERLEEQLDIDLISAIETVRGEADGEESPTSPHLISPGKSCVLMASQSDSELLPVDLSPIEIFRGDRNPGGRKAPTKKTAPAKRGRKVATEDKAEDLEVEIPRMSRIRPLLPSNKVNQPEEVKSRSKIAEPKVKKTDQAEAKKKNVDDEAISSLRGIQASLAHNPPAQLYRRVCGSLALALLRRRPLADPCRPLADPWSPAHCLVEGQAITFRHKALLSWRSRLRKLEREETDPSSATPASTQGPGQGPSEDVAGQRLYLQRMRDAVRFNKTQEDLQEALKGLPQDWVVCQVSVITNPRHRHKHMVVCRLTPQGEPLVMEMEGFSDTAKTSALLQEYARIFQRSSESIDLKDRAKWWKDRYALDDDMKTVLEKLEHQWLGSWKCLLQGQLSGAADCDQLGTAVDRLLGKWGVTVAGRALRGKLEVFLASFPHLSERECIQGVLDLSRDLDLSVTPDDLSGRLEGFKNAGKSLNLSVCARGPVVLVLDKEIQHLPWENLPSLQTQQMTRMPSVYFLSAHYAALAANDSSVLAAGVESRHTFYILDPDANLPATQEKFQGWFEKEGWQGLVHQKPTATEFKQGISGHDLFIYCGHGCGAKYLSQDALEMTPCHAASLLMGCSSGKLVANGNLEPSGTMLHYFMAGGPCMMGCLWDITDRDIDRYTEALLRAWLATRGRGLLDVQAAGRDACKLRYLTGAAPVVYGLPVRMGLSDTGL